MVTVQRLGLNLGYLALRSTAWIPDTLPFSTTHFFPIREFISSFPRLLLSRSILPPCFHNMCPLTSTTLHGHSSLPLSQSPMMHFTLIGLNRRVRVRVRQVARALRGVYRQRVRGGGGTNGLSLS